MKPKIRKLLIFVTVISMGLFFFYQFVRMFGAGTDPYAEYYELNYSEDKVQKAIETIKKENPNIAGGSFYQHKDKADYVNHVYFSLNHYIIVTWTRPSSPNTTTFAFVAREGEGATWQKINDDFGFFENRRIKKAFEEKILNKLQHELAK